jgi:AcrR family transcriptional regulator
MNIHSVTATTHGTPPMTDRVLDAALAAFTEGTYGGTSVPQVAARAGIGVGTIYRSFTGKESLANAVFRRAKAGMLDHLTRAVAGLPDDARARERVLAVWSGLAAYAEADPAGFAFLEHQQHEAYLDEESAALSARVEVLAVELVREGQAAGDLREGDPAVLVALVFGAFVGLTKHFRSLGTGPDPATVAATGEAAWHLVAAPSPSRHTPTHPTRSHQDPT